MSKLHYGPAAADGSRQVFDDGRCIGRLMPEISQATAEASPGLQTWSHPRAKGGPGVKLWDPQAVAKFADHWERHYQRTYPLHDDGQEVPS